MKQPLHSLSEAELTQIVYNAVCTTLETVAFEEPIPRLDRPRLPVNGIGAKVVIEMPVEVELTVWMTSEAAKQIAMSISGVFEEKELKPEDLTDVVAELTNVLAGQLANVLLVPDEGYTLGLPSTWEGGYITTVPTEHYLYEIGSELLAVNLSWKS